jgi:hypothetical protein
MVWRGPEDLLRLLADQGMANKRRSKDELQEIDALLERLREFIRLNYMTAAEVARQIGVRDTRIYDWLLGQARPAKTECITAF